MLADLLVGERDHQRADDDGEEHGQEARQGVAGGDLAQHATASGWALGWLRSASVRGGAAGARLGGLVGAAHATTSFGRSPVIISPRVSRGVSPGTMPTTCPR